MLADPASIWVALLMTTGNHCEAHRSPLSYILSCLLSRGKKGQCGGWASEAIVFLCQLFVVVAIGLLLALYMLE